jgi:DNA-binding response OmpR family regulator
MRVLVVDDERDIRESLEEFLTDEGFDVEIAADGAEALTLLGGEPLPCVVILDLLMPVLSGTDLFEKMQHDERLSTIPVIVSTSDPSRAPSVSAILKKPINLDRLLDTVRHYCSS